MNDYQLSYAETYFGMMNLLGRENISLILVDLS